MTWWSGLNKEKATLHSYVSIFKYSRFLTRRHAIKFIPLNALIRTYLGHLNLIWHQFNSFRRIPYLLFMMYSSRYTLYSHHCFKVGKTRLGGSTNKEDASVIQGYKYSGDVQEKYTKQLKILSWTTIHAWRHLRAIVE